ncbi:unnamed protein product [Calypogeia fissa]
MEMDIGEGKEGRRIMSLPSNESLSPYLCNLLNQNFNFMDDLAAAPSLFARLRSELDRDNEKFCKVQARVFETTIRGLSYYEILTRSLRQVGSEINHVGASNPPLTSLENDLSEDGSTVSDAVSTNEKARDDNGGAWEDLESLEIESIMNPNSAENTLDGFALNRRSMVEELEALASEVARVERMRLYAESVLKLEQLVGDLEASIAMISSSGRATAQIGSSAASLRITRAVQRMQITESAMAEIARAHWNSLVSAVDLRVDRVAAILRPAAIADHRGVLISIGWPPPLSATSGGGPKLANPLLQMGEVQELKYCQSFMALTTLQAVQQSRRERQLKEYKISMQEVASPSGSEFSTYHSDGARRKTRSSHASLWAVEELISPMSSKAETHFLRWTTKPELVFALAYRIAQEYADVIDDFLQPLIDKAKVAGYSAREEWIFSVVDMASNFLRAHVLPGLANDLRDEGGAGSVGAALWLHIVDQALAFDSRMKSLAMRTGSLFQEGSNEEDQSENLDNLSGPVTLSISAIADQPEWLALWAKLELADVLVKLRVDLQTDIAWTLRSKSPASAGLPGGDYQEAYGPSVTNIGDFLPPSGADFVLSSMSAITDRCRTLLEPQQQYKFIEIGVMPIAGEYLEDLLRRCMEVEASTALAEEDSMVKVATCLNAARYCEHALQEWGEDIFFLELLEVKYEDSEGAFELLEGSLFHEEIEKLKYFRQDWIGRLVAAISRGFDARCREYLRNKKRWLETGKGVGDLDGHFNVSEIGDREKLSLRQFDLLDENYVNILKGFDVSASLVEALAVLQSQLRTLRVALDNAIFFELWRSLATELDQLLVNSVILSGAKFSEHGGWQFAADIQALFLVFKPYCVRPSGFFKTTHDAVRLLTLPSQAATAILQTMTPSPGQFRDVVELPQQKLLASTESLKEYGVRKLPPPLAQRILNCRVLPRL